MSSNECLVYSNIKVSTGGERDTLGALPPTAIANGSAYLAATRFPNATQCKTQPVLLGRIVTADDVTFFI